MAQSPLWFRPGSSASHVGCYSILTNRTLRFYIYCFLTAEFSYLLFQQQPKCFKLSHPLFACPPLDKTERERKGEGESEQGRREGQESLFHPVETNFVIHRCEIFRGASGSGLALTARNTATGSTSLRHRRKCRARHFSSQPARQI